MANPTWMSTQSPGCELLVLEQPDVDDPGHPRHVGSGQLVVACRRTRPAGPVSRGTCAAPSLAPVLDRLEHQLVPADQLDVDRAARRAGQRDLVALPGRPRRHRSGPAPGAAPARPRRPRRRCPWRRRRTTGRRPRDGRGGAGPPAPGRGPPAGRRPVARWRRRSRCTGRAHARRSRLLHGDDLDPDVHLGLDLQHQDPGRLHAELPDVEAGTARRARSSSSSTAWMVISSSWRRDTPRKVTSPLTR